MSLALVRVPGAPARWFELLLVGPPLLQKYEDVSQADICGASAFLEWKSELFLSF